ncbi:MAG: GldG family protein [Planctomycetota bacterium]
MELSPKNGTHTGSEGKPGGEPKPASQAPTFARSQRVAFALNVLLMVVISLGIVVGLNYLATRPGLSERFDVSASRVYELGEKTRKVLDELETDVTAYLFLDAQDPMLRERPNFFALTFDHVRSVLREYEKLSGDRLEVIDLATLEPTRRFQIDREIGGFDRANVVMFRAGDRVKTVPIEGLALVASERETEGNRVREPRIRGWRSEDVFTSALVQITEETSKIYFTTGHGEASLRPDPSAQDMLVTQQWAGALSRDGYVLAELDLTETGEIPSDADLLVVALPHSPFQDTEAAILRRWVLGGGRLLWLDSRTGGGAEEAPVPAPGLFEGFGVSVSTRVVVQWPLKAFADKFGAEAFLILNQLELVPHPITVPLITRQLTLSAYQARPIEISSALPPGVTVQPLLKSLPDAWSKIFRQGVDLKFDQVTDVARQFDLAVAVERKVPGDEEKAGRMVLVSGNIAISAVGGLANKNFFSNAVSWLSSREHLIGIDPKDYEELSVRLEADRIQVLSDTALIYIPVALILLGLLVWWRRR